MGTFFFFKVLSGVVNSFSSGLINPEGLTENLGQLYLANGSKFRAVNKLVAGDLGVVRDLNYTFTDQVLHNNGFVAEVQKTHYPQPFVEAGIAVNEKSSKRALLQALDSLKESDPTMNYHFQEITGELILVGYGDLHLKSLQWTLRECYGIDIDLIRPRTLFHVGITKTAEGSHSVTKEDEEIADLLIEMEPIHQQKYDETKKTREFNTIQLPWGGRFDFINYASDERLSPKTVESIKRILKRILHADPIFQSHVSNIQVSILKGVCIDSLVNEQELEECVAVAFAKAFLKSEPWLSEPIYNTEVNIASRNVASVLEELQRRNAIIERIESIPNGQTILAKIPHQHLFQLSNNITNITDGRGYLTLSFSTYSRIPKEQLYPMKRKGIYSLQANPIT